MKKKLSVIHGDKGGAGKSTFAFLHADFLLYHHGQIVIVEGDKKISGVADRLFVGQFWDNAIEKVRARVHCFARYLVDIS